MKNLKESWRKTKIKYLLPPMTNGERLLVTLLALIFIAVWILV